MRNSLDLTNATSLTGLASATFPKTFAPFPVKAYRKASRMKAYRKASRIALALCLALSLSCISTALQAQPAQATQTTFKHVSDMTPLKEVKPGGTLIHNKVYKVTEDLKYNTKNMNMSCFEVLLNATTYIYIAPGSTLALRASANYPAIHVPEGSTVVIGGAGTLSLSTDHAESGWPGSQGGNGRASGNDGNGGNGGDGGKGGHGGAAYIGGAGGAGGAGGKGGAGGYGKKDSSPGRDGGKGGNAGNGENAGKIYIIGEVKVCYEKTGYPPVSGRGGAGGSSQKTGQGDPFSNCRWSGGGGGGGGGGRGFAADFGGGGAGGAGGGGGGGAGFVCKYWNKYGATYGEGGQNGSEVDGTNGASGSGNRLHYDNINGDGGRSGKRGEKASNGTCQGFYVGNAVSGVELLYSKKAWDGSWTDIQEAYYYVGGTSPDHSSMLNAFTGELIPLYDYAVTTTKDGKKEAAITGYHGYESSLTIPKHYRDQKTGELIPVTSIGKGAFTGLSIEQVSIPDSVTTIGSEAFMDCTKLKTVKMPDGVTAIKSCAFSGCTSLAPVTLPSELKTIGAGAFSKCTSLKSIEVPDKVTKIGKLAFSACSSLTELRLLGKKTDADDVDVWNDCPLKHVYLWKSGPLGPNGDPPYDFGSAELLFWENGGKPDPKASSDSDDSNDSDANSPEVDPGGGGGSVEPETPEKPDTPVEPEGGDEGDGADSGGAEGDESAEAAMGQVGNDAVATSGFSATSKRVEFDLVTNIARLIIRR